jgi:5'-3' exonuclease
LTTALIDGDIVTYRCAAANENNDEGIARWQAGQMIDGILNETEATSAVVFLTGSTNFRFDIYPDYKANRKDFVKPKWHPSIREYLCSFWNATVSNGCEADDLMGVAQCAGPGTVICSIDKDMLMIPGMHFNFVKKEFREVSPIDGLRHLYWQAIMGDKVDNIPGFDGLMRNKVPKKMEWMINELHSLTEEKDMYDFLCSVHCAGVDLDTCLKCLWIWRKDNDIWQNPMERSAT